MIPHPSFLKLEYEKQEVLRNVCLEEFARAGYSSASTNAMCKNAGISKGLLFYYFGSKKELFIYLVDYCTIILRDSFYDGLVLDRENIFERMINLTMRKWSLYVRRHIVAKPNIKLLLAILSKLRHVNSKNSLYFYGKFSFSPQF